MRTRFLLITAALLIAAPAFADPAKPNLVVQLKPVDEWLGDARSIAKAVAPLMAGENKPAADPEAMLEEMLTGVLGKDWRKAVDTSKPLGAYAVFKPELVESVLVIMLPTRDEKALRSLLGNFGVVKLEKDDVYSLTTMTIPLPLWMRFENGYAYLATLEGSVGKGNLLKPADVFSAKETASLTARLQIDSLPDEFKKIALAGLDDLAKAGAQDGQTDSIKKMIQSYLDQVKMVLTDGREFTLGLDFDRKVGDLAIVSELSAKAGTLLAKTLAEAKPTVSRFAAMAKDAAAYFGQRHSLSYNDSIVGPQFDTVVENAQKALAELGTKLEKDKVEKLLRSAFIAMGDETDSGLAINAGSAGGPSTIVYGMSIKDGPKLEQTLKDLVKELPEDVRGRIRLDAGKIGSVNLHRIDLGKDAPPEMKKLFGKAEATVAIGADVVFVALGADAEKHIKAGLDATPQPAPMMVIEASLAKIWPLMESMAKSDADRADMKRVRELLGKDVDKVRLFHLTRTTGETVKYRAGIDLLPIVKLVASLGVRTSSAPLPPVVEPKKP